MFGTARSGYNPFPGLGPLRPVIHHMSTPAATRRLSSPADLPKWVRTRRTSADSGIGVDAAHPASPPEQHRRTLPGPERTYSTRWQGPELTNAENMEARPDTAGSAHLQQDTKVQQSMDYEQMTPIERDGGGSPRYTPLPPVQQHKTEEAAPAEIRPWRAPGETDIFNRGAVFGKVSLVEQPKFERPADSATQRQAASNDADQAPRESGPAETGADGADLRPWRAPGETDIFNRGAVFGTVPLVPQPKYEPPAESPRRTKSASPRQTADDSLKAKQELAPLDPAPWRNPGETDIFNRGAVFGVVPFVPQPKFEPPAESPRRTKSASTRQTADRDDSVTAKQELPPLDPAPWRNPGETDIFNRGAVFGVVRSVPQPKFDQPEDAETRKPSSPKDRDRHTTGDQQTGENHEPKIWRGSETGNFNEGAMFHVVSSVPQPNLHREAENNNHQDAKQSDQAGGDYGKGETQETAGTAQQAQAPIIWKGSETSNFNKGAMFHVVSSVPQPNLHREAENNNQRTKTRAGSVVTMNTMEGKHKRPRTSHNRHRPPSFGRVQRLATSTRAPPNLHREAENNNHQDEKPEQVGGDHEYTEGETQETADITQQAQAPIIWKGSETSNFNKGAMFHVVSSVPQPYSNREADNLPEANQPDQAGGNRDYRGETEETAGTTQQAQAPAIWKGSETSNFNKGAMFHVVSSVPQPTYSQGMDTGGSGAPANGQNGANTQDDNNRGASPTSQHVSWKGAETTDFSKEVKKGQETYTYNRGAAIALIALTLFARVILGCKRLLVSGVVSSLNSDKPLIVVGVSTGAKRPPTKWTTSARSRQHSAGRGILRTMDDNVAGPPAGRSSPETKLPRLDSAGKPRVDSSRLRRGRYGTSGGGLTAVDDTVPLPEPSRQDRPLTKVVRLRRAVDLPNSRCLFDVQKTGPDPWKAGRHSRGKRPFPKSEYVSSFQRWFPSRHYQGSKSAWAHRAGSANSERGFVQPSPDLGSRHA
uniref:Uncharacterized protein n=1 Tax=Branchiostoma floridae TaxID=7739 RepID=C3ZXL4_BRAFL|eukprot:XP_002586727.1 hypothetical protein BRAFLDRAFT_77488 [Branchiostoma floridae]